MEGTIIKQISNLYTVETNNELHECRARGKFYHDKLTPLVGDKVKIDEKNNYILELLPRINSLERPSIANVDTCIIIASLKEPDLDLNLLDKLLCIIIHNKIKPVICLTKKDLLNFKEKKEIKSILKYYQKIGIKSYYNTDLKKITKEIANQTVVLTGQTGAGKSSLLNRLDKNLKLDTNPISKSLGRGIHTTRHVELFKYKASLIADTPGFSALDINTLSVDEIKNTYPEFNVNCAFKDCKHLKEDDCEVKRLVKNGKILESRYNNYLKFMR